jgi:hypothetical protein
MYGSDHPVLVAFRSILRMPLPFTSVHARGKIPPFSLELDITIKNHGWPPRDFAGGCAKTYGANGTV